MYRYSEKNHLMVLDDAQVSLCGNSCQQVQIWKDFCSKRVYGTVSHNYGGICGIFDSIYGEAGG